MKSTYVINFEQLKKTYQKIFDALERAFKKFDVDFYLIGAQSRDVWTNHLQLKKRTTRDIDYCVYVKDHATWKALNDYLIEEEGFKRDSKEAYRFYLEEDIVDLIPFGGIEQNGEVILDNPRTELSVYGCKEVTEEAVVLEENFKVVTLSGLCIMKLVAYDEKPDRRAKDYDDFLFVLKNYAEIAGEQLFQEDFDDLIDENLDMQLASARMLGRNIAAIVNKNPDLKKRIIDILSKKLQGHNYEDIDHMYRVRDENDQVIVQLKLISETIKGIQD